LLQVYAERDASAITEGVLRDVARFAKTRAQQDDMTCSLFAGTADARHPISLPGSA